MADRNRHNGESTGRPADKRSALVVESDAGNASVVSQSLRNLGFCVNSVVSGVEAVIAARKKPPTVIFIAIQLRDVGGLDLAMWLRANPTLQSVPIVAMHSTDDDTPDLGKGVFSAHLKNPTSSERVAEVLRNTFTSGL